MRKDNRDKQSGAAAILLQSSSGLTRGSRLNNKAIMFDVDSRVKRENDVIKRGAEGDRGGWKVDSRIKSENDNTFVKGCHGWKKSGGVAVLAISVVFCLCAGEALAQCAVPPTCESLGYNLKAADCEGKRALKCPFDASKVFCSQTKYEGIGIGDIYYSDGTIDGKILSAKTPVGIVAYVNGNSGFVVALKESLLLWSHKRNNVSCLPDLAYSEAKVDMNGKKNMSCILSQKNDTYPAAQYCHNYKPVTSGKGSSGWYLPASGELVAISNNYDAINLSLSKMGESELAKYNDYWSSSEINEYSAWYVNAARGALFNFEYKDEKELKVRCLLAF